MGEELNPVEKVLLACVNGSLKVIDTVDEKFGIDLLDNVFFDKLNALEEKNIKFQKEHPVLNIGRQMLKGTVKGLIGAYHHK